MSPPPPGVTILRISPFSYTPGIVVGIAQPVPLPIGEPLVVAVLGVVAVLRHPLPVVVVLGQVAGVLVARVGEARVVLGVVLAGDAVEAGVVAVPVPVLGGDSMGSKNRPKTGQKRPICTQRWTKRWMCFAKQQPGRARQEFLAT